MDQLLTLEEAAKILNVDYKSVYRLVRSGELRAGRIGRVYRIARDDLEAFFESTKAGVAQEAGRAEPPRAADGPWVCCVSGDTFISALDFGGWSTDTHEPICRAAWAAGWKTSRRAGASGPVSGTPPIDV